MEIRVVTVQFENAETSVPMPADLPPHLVERLMGTPAAIARLRALAPDAVIVDVSGRRVDESTALLRRIRGASPRSKILVIGDAGDIAMAREAVLAGAAAYLSRHRSAFALSEALRSIVKGGWHLSPTGKQAVASLLGNPG